MRTTKDTLIITDSKKIKKRNFRERGETVKINTRISTFTFSIQNMTYTSQKTMMKPIRSISHL
jgi:hypothetical protein